MIELTQEEYDEIIEKFLKENEILPIDEILVKALELASKYKIINNEL